MSEGPLADVGGKFSLACHSKGVSCLDRVMLNSPITEDRTCSILNLGLGHLCVGWYSCLLVSSKIQIDLWCANRGYRPTVTGELAPSNISYLIWLRPQCTAAGSMFWLFDLPFFSSLSGRTKYQNCCAGRNPIICNVYFSHQHTHILHHSPWRQHNFVCLLSIFEYHLFWKLWFLLAGAHVFRFVRLTTLKWDVNRD